MTEEAKPIEEPVKTPEDVAVKDDGLLKAREAERTRFSREESLRRELEETKRKLESVKKNGWDLDVLSSKPRDASLEPDVKEEVKQIRQELEQERNRRADIEELQSIVDFVHKNDKYELIRQLDDGAKFVQTARKDYFQKTGKYLSFEEACDYIEEQVEKAEIDRYSRFSKTKKAEKLYQLPKSAEPPKVATTLKQPAKAPEAVKPPDQSFHRSSKQAFEILRKQHGVG